MSQPLLDDPILDDDDRWHTDKEDGSGEPDPPEVEVALIAVEEL